MNLNSSPTIVSLPHVGPLTADDPYIVLAACVYGKVASMDLNLLLRVVSGTGCLC